MKKYSSIEESSVSDRKSGKDIYVSTTTRILFRKLFKQYEKTPNVKLNKIIATEFSRRSNNVLHYFKLKNKGESVGEIRGAGNFYFISSITDHSITIITIQSKILKPKYKTEAPLEPDDEGMV